MIYANKKSNNLSFFNLQSKKGNSLFIPICSVSVRGHLSWDEFFFLENMQKLQWDALSSHSFVAKKNLANDPWKKNPPEFERAFLEAYLFSGRNIKKGSALQDQNHSFKISINLEQIWLSVQFETL